MSTEITSPPGRSGQVCELLTDAFRRSPDRVAITDENGDWTFRQLHAAVLLGAGILAAQGVRPGDRVLARLGNTREAVAWLFATLWQGAVHVPVNPGMTDYQLKSVVADCEPALVLVRDRDLDLMLTLGIPTLDPDHLDLADHLVQADGPDRAGAGSAGPTGGGDDLALLIYTSGSTAAPKGVASPHRCVLFAADAIAERLAYRADDVVLTAIPLAFDYGLYQVFLSLIGGSHLVLTDPTNTLSVRAAIYRHGVTVLPAVPSLADGVIRMIARGNRSRPPLRMITNTGAALSEGLIRALREALPDTSIVPMFGITECKRVSINEPDGDLLRPGSLGRALSGTRILILDDDGNPLPAGQIGEIAVEGPHVMAGYWRAPELTAQRFRPTPNGPRLHTGDYGRLDADGYLYFEGRRDDLFKRRGYRMSTTEIEAAAMDITGVRSAVVLPPTTLDDLTIMVVASLDPDAVLAGLRRRLERAKVPARCILLDSIPLTPNGKFDRKALRHQLESTPARQVA